MPTPDTPDPLSTQLEALRVLRRRVWEVGEGLRQPTQFQAVEEGSFLRIRVVEGQPIPPADDKRR